ncbi:substrate-binding domain-containing protein [Celeribacter sp.]|uniref:substrate-binding domain-containing protein n=1 Tax=Celeribacter sp. TaxID=1890673 RepID=UPI003A8EE7D0
MTELRILAGGGIAASMRAIAPRFERATGNQVNFFFGTTPELIAEATSGAKFDAGVLPHEVYADVQARAHFTAQTPIDIAYVGLGVAVRAGNAKPDIHSPDALRSTLISAKSLATIPESAAGMQIMRLFEKLSISKEMARKTRVKKAPPDVVQSLASGETELGMFLANVFKIAPEVDLLTPFPDELQQKVNFAAAVAKNTSLSSVASEFIACLKTAESAALIRENGMSPFA